MRIPRLGMLQSALLSPLTHACCVLLEFDDSGQSPSLDSHPTFKCIWYKVIGECEVSTHNLHVSSHQRPSCTCRATKRSKGIALAQFAEPSDAVDAHAALDGTVFQGRLLHVLPGHRPPPKPTDTEGAEVWRHAPLPQHSSWVSGSQPHAQGRPWQCHLSSHERSSCTRLSRRAAAPRPCM